MVTSDTADLVPSRHKVSEPTTHHPPPGHPPPANYQQAARQDRRLAPYETTSRLQGLLRFGFGEAGLAVPTDRT